MGTSHETFWNLVFRAAKRPLVSFSGNPLQQSAAAAGVNLWCLALAVLGQFWVFFSAGLLLGQTYNTWLVANGRMRPSTGLVIGLFIVLVNFSALGLAVLLQFWVFTSIALACWQFVCLTHVCEDRLGRIA